ncbi:MAG: PAS domain-containing protein [Alphaproteobacteria bacterium]|jgi:two-component sensor histidine kinase|nr:PAS domain-containing protein [Alphaproteobacteria bacterium]
MTLDDLYRHLRKSHILAQGIVDTVRAPLMVLDGALRVVTANPSYYETFNTDSENTVERSLFEIDGGRWDIPDLRDLLVKTLPRAAAIEGFEVEEEVPDVGPRTLVVNARRIVGTGGSEIRILLSIQDLTGERRAREQKERLVEDLNHRLRNVLTLVQSLAMQTATRDRTAEEYRDALLGRLNALARSQGLLAEGDGGDSIDLQRLATDILRPHMGSRSEAVSIAGESVHLPHKKSVTLGLVLHELSTNAAKYGALAVPEGTVRLSWSVMRVAEGRRVTLEWREMTDAREDRAEYEEGFGMRFIRNAVKHDLDGTAEIGLEPDGLSCRLDVPID